MKLRTGALVVLLTLALACREPAPPAYVRLSGPAPALTAAPEARALLVSFWATWCPPCREETPALTALAKDPPEGMRVVIVSEDLDPDVVRTFLGGAPDPALHLRLDASQALMRSFGVDQLPTTFLIVDGRQVARFQGPRQWDSAGMEKLLTRLIREAPVP